MKMFYFQELPPDETLPPDESPPPPRKTPLTKFDDDDIDDVISDLIFPQIPAIILEKISSHVEYVKKFAYYEGRVSLLKRTKNAGIQMQECNTSALSSLNFEGMFKEHITIGPRIETKLKSNTDWLRVESEIKSYEENRDKFKSKIDESKILLKCILNPNSYDLIVDLLDRTLNDIRSNVGKSNNAIFQNYSNNFNLNKLLEYRWRSLLSDVSAQKKKVNVSESFKEFIRNELSTPTSVSASTTSNSSSSSGFTSSVSSSTASNSSSSSISVPSNSSSSATSLPTVFKPKSSSTPRNMNGKDGIAGKICKKNMKRKYDEN